MPLSRTLFWLTATVTAFSNWSRHSIALLEADGQCRLNRGLQFVLQLWPKPPELLCCSLLLFCLGAHVCGSPHGVEYPHCASGP
jgi:hypothetical protein